MKGTKIYSPLRVDFLNNANIAMLHDRFGFHSMVLERAGLKADIWLEAGFVFDFESVPEILRGPLGVNKRGGAGHDGVCRIGMVPGITKRLAAWVYKELMDYCDSIDELRFLQLSNPHIPAFAVKPYVTFRDWSRRWVKSVFVWVWPGDYFLKWRPGATALEIYGLEGDPYISVAEKIEAAIVKAEEIVADIKDIPIIESPMLVAKAGRVVEGLENAKKTEESK